MKLFKRHKKEQVILSPAEQLDEIILSVSKKKGRKQREEKAKLLFVYESMLPVLTEDEKLKYGNLVRDSLSGNQTNEVTVLTPKEIDPVEELTNKLLSRQDSVVTKVSSIHLGDSLSTVMNVLGTDYIKAYKNVYLWFVDELLVGSTQFIVTVISVAFNKNNEVVSIDIKDKEFLIKKEN